MFAYVSSARDTTIFKEAKNIGYGQWHRVATTVNRNYRTRCGYWYGIDEQTAYVIDRKPTGSHCGYCFGADVYNDLTDAVPYSEPFTAPNE